MKPFRYSLFLLFASAACILSACSSHPDAGLLFRESKNNADQIKSCSASLESTLQFETDGVKHTSQNSSQIVFCQRPFALKSVQAYQKDGSRTGGESYTLEQNGSMWFYSRSGANWQKSSSPDLDTAPRSQIDILRLLDKADGQKYVRETDVGGQKAHKLELSMNAEILRDPIETIATVSGIASGSKTVVQTLLDGAPPLYGYCYIGKDTGQIMRMEFDLTKELNSIFESIDGSQVKIHVTKYTLSGDISNLNAAPAVKLPAEAASASSIQAYG